MACILNGKMFLLTIFAVLIANSSSPSGQQQQQQPLSFMPNPSRYMIFGYDADQVSSYNPSEQRCCAGILVVKESNSYRRCCGDSDYDSTTEACCSGQMYPKQIGFECCDSQYFNVSENLCCRSGLRSQIIKFPDAIRDSPATRRNTQCCGARLYDTRIKLCCSLPAPNTLTFRVVDKMYPSTICCKGKAFNARAGRCSDNIIPGVSLPRPPRPFIPRPFPPPFFGPPPFPMRPMPMPRPMPRPFPVIPNFRPPPQPEFSARADAAVSTSFTTGLIRRPFLNRCNGKQFDPASDMCCGEYKPNDINPESGLVVVPRPTFTTACCGDTTYDFAKQMCCDGVPITLDFQKPKICCGKEAYDPTTEWCCDAPSSRFIPAREMDGDYCCGPEGTVYSYDKQMCCDGTLLEIPEGLEATSVSCCSATGGEAPALFNNTDQRCCDGTIVNLPEGTVAASSYHLQCCGKALLNFRRAQCCNGLPLLRMSNQSCCRGNAVFNPSTQLCCNTVVEKSSPRQRLCCGDKAYNPSNETCCADPQTAETTVSVRNRSFRFQSCCGGTSYDPTQQTCCGNRLISKNFLCCTAFNENGEFQSVDVEKSNTSVRCCGLSGYNPLTERCCKYIPVPLEKDKNFCCGEVAYNSATQICCGSELFERGGENPVNACCGVNAYNTTTSICCGGHIKERKEGQVTACCFPHQTDWN